MAEVEERNIVDVPTVVEWTGLNRKTVSSWANERSKLPTLDARVQSRKLFDWSVVRPLLIALSKDLDRKPPKRWPQVAQGTSPA